MRKTLNASILVLVLCCSARAGNIPSTPGAPPPPPPPSATAGEMPNMSESLIEAALALLSVVLP